MTSSLVGSEMCIRDRPFKATACFIACEVGAESRLLPRRDTCGVTSGFMCCLLYTSDAADDM
eukprot:3181446-Prorocentrum_lima.AAC.1